MGFESGPLLLIIRPRGLLGRAPRSAGREEAGERHDPEAQGRGAGAAFGLDPIDPVPRQPAKVRHRPERAAGGLPYASRELAGRDRSRRSGIVSAGLRSHAFGDKIGDQTADRIGGHRRRQAQHDGGAGRLGGPGRRRRRNEKYER